MRFELSQDQVDFQSALRSQLSDFDLASVNRRWAGGDHSAGREVWTALAELGVNGLMVPQRLGGAEASAAELVVAFETIGWAVLPGPWIETVAALPGLVEDPVAERLAAGEMATLAAPPHTPLALDADVATHRFVLTDAGLATGLPAGEPVASVDPTRRLFNLEASAPADLVEAASSLDLATLACAAELLGCAERLLADSVAYVKQRRQFGREIGSYQAIKHQLADCRIAVDFARPLVWGAALDPTPQAVSAAKVGAAEAAYRTARTALQVHGAIGYTAEFDLSLWLTRVRALVGAWGTPTVHRRRVLESLGAPC